jgi:hypothetical protein
MLPLTVSSAHTRSTRTCCLQPRQPRSTSKTRATRRRRSLTSSISLLPPRPLRPTVWALLEAKAPIGRESTRTFWQASRSLLKRDCIPARVHLFKLNRASTVKAAVGENESCSLARTHSQTSAKVNDTLQSTRCDPYASSLT